jgi:hypothetical protein
MAVVGFGLRRKAAIAVAVGLLVGAAGAPTTAQAQYQMAPWCAYLGSWGGSYDCSYYSFKQCMATASGIGNICLRNPRNPGPLPQSPRRARQYYQYY